MKDKGLCGLIERKQDFTNDFLRIIFQVKNMHKIHDDKYKAGDIDACPCKYKIGDHFLTTLETNLISLLSSILMCFDRCIYENDIECSLDDVKSALDDFKVMRTEVYLPPLQCGSVSTAFTRLFMDIMDPVDNYFIDGIIEEFIKFAKGEEESLQKLESLVVDYVDTFMLSLYGLAIDCNEITNYEELEPKCINDPHCPIHKKWTELKITIFLIDSLINENLHWIEHLLVTIIDHYENIKELNLLIDFRFVKEDKEIDTQRVVDLVELAAGNFKTIRFLNVNTDLPCIRKLIDLDAIKANVKFGK